MTSKRPPAPPPRLAGFTYLEVLGSGGFADVYLFEQQLPRRRVAVKVLLPDRMVDGSAEQFAAEANVMAMLSTHPAIVTIYQAGVSDDGRPYLVMEYCPKPNLQTRSRAAAMSVAEALRVGVQVAAAVETAHRAGILHRDIKPANILVTEYNRPALTDFGIATTADGADPSAGMSIPWSPPESFADVPEFGVRSDVYALGASLYTLLAGRSPFEVAGGRNGGADLIQRIESQPLVPIERPDAPASLQLVLERAMAKRAADRYESAVAFARALQKVQIELAHAVTPIDILDDSPLDDLDDDGDGELTRVRGIVSIEPQTSPAAGQTQRRGTSPVFALPPAADDTVRSGRAALEHTDPTETVRAAHPVSPYPTAPPAPVAFPGPSHTTAPGAPPGAPAPGQPRRSRRGLWIGLGAGAVAVAAVTAVVVGASLLGPQPSPSPSETAPVVVDPQDPLEGRVPPPQAGTAEVRDGRVVFAWTNAAPQDGDTFLWQTVTLEGLGDPLSVVEPTVTVPVSGDSRTCIEVTLLRVGGTYSDPTRICTD